MSYSDAYIDEFRLKVKELGFVGADFLETLTNDQIKRNINGIGSAGMNSTLRKALDKLHPSLVYASHIHDLQWVFVCDGSEADFLLSNEQFETNGVIRAKSLHGWWNPIRYLAIRSAKRFRKILDEFGYSAYVSAKRVE